MRKFLYVLLSIALLIPSLSGCGAAGAKTGTPTETFKVGAIYPMSGTNAFQGQQCMTAVRTAVEFVNANGGVGGRQVELFEADAPDPNAAATEAGRLIDQKGVQVIFGSLASGNAVAIAGVCDKSGVVLVESGGIADALTDQGFKCVFRILDKGGLRGAAGVNYIAGSVAERLGVPVEELKLAIIHEDSSYGESVAAGARNKAAELGIQLVSDQSYNVSLRDMSALALNVKDAKPDVLLTVNYVDDAILLLDTLRQYQAVPKVLMGCGAGTTSPKFAQDIGPDSDGVFCTDMPTNLSLDVYAADPQVQKTVSDFRAAFLEAYPDMTTGSIAAEAAFSGAYTFMNNILPNAKSLDFEGMREAALSTKLPLTTLGFGWDIGEDGQNYAAAANINQWQGGKVVTVFPDNMKNGEAVNVPLPYAGI
ncbi:MAG: ABC transporter substrate-binding protein [Clostridiales Family XIII bacterium]|jgi:branched-chain amino acid transport system substrate-binding protein|nr:ABC transporter substrate-binding protein [Clostridiales Family XIII bacterium]